MEQGKREIVIPATESKCNHKIQMYKKNRNSSCCNCSNYNNNGIRKTERKTFVKNNN